MSFGGQPLRRQKLNYCCGAKRRGREPLLCRARMTPSAHDDNCHPLRIRCMQQSTAPGHVSSTRLNASRTPTANCLGGPSTTAHGMARFGHSLRDNTHTENLRNNTHHAPLLDRRPTSHPRSSSSPWRSKPLPYIRSTFSTRGTNVRWHDMFSKQGHNDRGRGR